MQIYEKETGCSYSVNPVWFLFTVTANVQNLWTFSLKSLCLHSTSEMMVLHFELMSECVYLYVFSRLWLEKRPVISQSPATQDRLYIWAPRYWHAL